MSDFTEIYHTAYIRIYTSILVEETAENYSL